MFTLNVTDEVSIQLLQLHNAEELFQLIDQNREHLREWLPWVDGMESANSYDSIIPAWLSQLADNNGFQAGIRFQGKLVGMIGLHTIDWRNKATSIGYYLAADVQGKGIMTKCVSRVLKYAFEDLKLHRVEIRCGKHNLKSRAIPERLGFTNEGVLRDGEWLYDHYHHTIIYGLLRPEWEQSTE